MDPNVPAPFSCMNQLKRKSEMKEFEGEKAGSNLNQDRNQALGR